MRFTFPGASTSTQWTRPAPTRPRRAGASPGSVRITRGGRVGAPGIPPSSRRRRTQPSTLSACARRSGSVSARSSACMIWSTGIGSARGNALRSFFLRSLNPAWTSLQSCSSSSSESPASGECVKRSRESTAESTVGTGSNDSRRTRRTIVASLRDRTNAVRYDQSPTGAATRSATSRWTSRTIRSAGCSSRRRR